MQLLSVLPDVATLVVHLADQVNDQAPDDEDVKAGWTAFAIFIGLIVAVALLGFSLVKQLRKAEAAEEAGLYDPSDKKLRAQAEQRAEQRAEEQARQQAEESGERSEPPTS